MGTKKKLGIKEKLRELFLGDEPPATSVQQKEKQPRQVCEERPSVTLKSDDRLNSWVRLPLASGGGRRRSFEVIYNLEEVYGPRLAEVSPDSGLVSSDGNEAAEVVGSRADKSPATTNEKTLTNENSASTRKIPPKSSYEKFGSKPIPTREVKLSIILLENTVTMAKEMEKIQQIIKSLKTTGFLCLINYGSSVSVLPRIKAEDFKGSELLLSNELSEKACLYDALVELEKVVKDNYNVFCWQDLKQFKIGSIDVVGIGTCSDNGSTASFDTGIKSFEKVASRANITTKYFCLNVDYFKNAAVIGFHSIGAINRNET